MCGRYSLAAHPEDLRAEFGIAALPEGYAPRYNIAPSQQVLALVGADGSSRCVRLQWGLVPSWADDAALGRRMINARAETVASKPAFRSSFRRQRCVVLADGFYEWQRMGTAKVPMRMRRSDGRLLALAGLWARRERAGEEALETCAIITTAANNFMASIHDRMPAILEDHSAAARWLDDDATPDELGALLRPAAEDLLDAYAVSPLVNSPRNDVPACIVPA
jgi:putative SOS response-associated peptidase YedK